MVSHLCQSCYNSRVIISENGFHYVCCLGVKTAINCMNGVKVLYKPKPKRERKENDMARYVKFDKIEPLPTDGVLDDITKSLQDWVWEAYKKGIKEQIVANTILIDKHFAKTNRIIVGNFDIPPMICGLEIKVTEELPDGYSFALVEAPKTERESIIEKAKTEVAREIFEEIYKSVASKIPMEIRPIFKDDRDFDGGFINGKRDALLDVLVLVAELKKKYTEDNNDG